MRSLFAKILLWFWATLAITIIGSALLMSLLEDDERPPFPARLVNFQLAEARHAWETENRTGLRAFLGRLESSLGGRGVLTDSSGRDLLTGKDYSEELERARQRGTVRRGRAMVRVAGDGRYWFLFFSSRPPAATVWFLRPTQWWVIGAAVLLCYLLAYHLTSPVRRLQKSVERFGQGNLSARAGSRRHDELGQLARTFDQMADRIETLLGAERRLLLDISHELRSPLARLGVAIELARSGDNRDAALDRIQKEAERLNALVGELLTVTRAEGDPGALRLAPVQLDELLREIVADAQLEAHARRSSLVLRDPAPDAAIEGDPELLRRAFENVVRNAVRYAPEGTAVEVALEAGPAQARVTVRDRGPGVPEEALDRIFDPFYRVETDRSRARGGVGLGLAIARRAVELHHGRIRARNAHPGLLVEMELPAGAAVSAPS